MSTQILFSRPDIWKAPRTSDEERIKAEAVRQGFYGITLREVAKRFDMPQLKVANILSGMLWHGQLTVREDSNRGFVYIDPIFLNGEALFGK